MAREQLRNKSTIDLFIEHIDNTHSEPAIKRQITHSESTTKRHDKEVETLGCVLFSTRILTPPEAHSQICQ